MSDAIFSDGNGEARLAGTLVINGELPITQALNPNGDPGLHVTDTVTGAVIETVLDGVGAGNKALLRLQAGGAGSARLLVRDSDVEHDGLIALDTLGSYFQPRSDAADATQSVEVVDKTGADMFVTQADGKIGFFGHAPAAQQTGVAVSAAGIHAALVALGLITA
jgi:hypothetical protein